MTVVSTRPRSDPNGPLYSDYCPMMTVPYNIPRPRPPESQCVVQEARSPSVVSTSKEPRGLPTVATPERRRRARSRSSSRLTGRSSSRSRRASAGTSCKSNDLRRRRCSSVSSDFKWSDPNVTTEAEDDHAFDALEATSAELPPIFQRPGSGTSRQSYADSARERERDRERERQLSGGLVMREKPALISIDMPSETLGSHASSKPYTSGGSAGSSASLNKDSSLSNSNLNESTRFIRTKSYTETGGSVVGTTKLETLFEKNHTRNGSNQTKDQSDGANGPRQQNAKTFCADPEESGRLTRSMRTDSYTNLSKYSDNYKSTKTKKSGLKKVQSEMNLSQYSVSHQSPYSPNTAKKKVPMRKRLSTATNPNFRPQPAEPIPHRPLRASKSNPNFSQADFSTSRQRKTSTEVDPVYDSDSDSEKERRILDWLMGVEDAERPISPEIIDEIPQQTDTAIHIIYDGD